MANGTDSEDYVVLSRVRPGLKREFAFALKSQSEFASGSIGRTRARRSQNGSLGNGVSQNSSNKRFKSCGSKDMKNDAEKASIEDKSVTGMEKSMSDEAVKSDKVGDMIGDDSEMVLSVSEEDEPKSDVVDLTSDDERKTNLVESAIRMEEHKDDVEKLVEIGSSDEPKINLVEAVSEEVEEPKDDVVQPMCEEVAEAEDQAKKSDSDKFPLGEHTEKVEVKPPCNGENSMEPAILSVDGIVENASPEKPIHSVLKSEAESTELSVTEDVKTEEVAESDVVSSLVTPANKLEMKMSKKIALKRLPTKLKELLETGLLEGLPVQYLRGSKVRGPTKTGLRGIIKGTGILCSCDMCGGTKVVTPNQFELHAGSANKRPPEYIYLENGNTFRDVLNACKDAPMDMLEVTIQSAIGCSSRDRPTFCLNCKGSISEAGTGKTMLLCNSCMALKDCQPSPTQMSDTGDRSAMSVSVSKSSDRISYISSSRTKSQGRLTRKDLRMHKLVFEEDVLPDGTELAYYARGQKLLSGYKKGSGIFCTCCRSEVSPSQFEAHAGWASCRKPYLHIYTSNGVSLHELSISLSKIRKFSAEENDDLCSICADGGDLLLCDNCPRAFHTGCVSLPSIPNGTWYCKYCQNMFQKEKFERNANAVAAGRVAGIDPIEQITKRCIRIVVTPEAEVGGCVLCRGHDFSKSGFGPRTVILCDQCEKEHHVGCLKEHKMDDLKELPKGKWFCCTDCERIHSALQKLVVYGEEKLPDSLLNVIKKKHLETSSESSANLDIRWRLLSGKMASDETRVLLSKAVAIFHDRFDPIADSSTSRLDLIPHMVYGRNWRDQEFGGMFCAILTVNSSVVCAGIIRVFGQEVAELPLVATSSDCQGQGYFQSLFSCIENLLQSLNVRNLVLPAADEAESLWKNKFGFVKISEDELKMYRKDYQMMVFQGTSMLHKSVG
uniref:PHD-type domain-containing protein n=1 Tax=Davidia involucrata TaxID=16924 RepID=A0A5B6ZWC6_DAVIN